ncbi:MAG TPA: sugar phosphate nucleotidyltransferase [Candidatus Methylomirabilis sp.]|nr:sugar phosphate nucleotidyltransferase [Candidatus Methylomirabilis sp.]
MKRGNASTRRIPRPPGSSGEGAILQPEATSDWESRNAPLSGNGWVIVLAGGQGRRLQPFLRKFLGSDRPKQFSRIVGSRSMLRHTWDRAVQVVPADRIVTVITAGQEPYIEAETHQGVPGTVLVQPFNRETAAGLLLPLVWIAHQSPKTTVAVFPADHFIWEEARFIRYVQTSMTAAEYLPDRVILHGAEASDPEPGYGWIAPAKPVMQAGAAELYQVRQFWEKPDRRTAEHLLASGCLWNTLVLVGRLEAYLRLADSCIPDVLSPLRAVACQLRTVAGPTSLRDVYRHLRSSDFSRDVLSRCPGRLLVQAVRGLYWSDWGDPDRIVRTLRRFERSPAWFPEYAEAQIAMDGGALQGNHHGLEGGHATI